MSLTDEQLATELRALRPAPRESFAAELDAWTAAGFPPSKAPYRQGADRVPSQPRRRSLRFMLPGSEGLRPALAGAAALVLAAVVAIAVLSTSGGGPDNGAVQELSRPSGTASSGAASSGAAPNAGTAGQRSAPDVQVAPVPGETVPPPVPSPTVRPRNGQPQVQERSASMTLSTDSGKLQGVADGVIEVTDRYDGFVDSSDVQAGGDRGRASFALRIPTTHLRDALADLSALAHVVSRDEGSVNVTGPYVTAGDRLVDARAQVDALLDDLRSASSADEIASIREQLDAARQELASARTELRSLKQRVSLTPVSVSITAAGDGSWSLGDAADDAIGVLETLGGAALVTLAVLVPLSALLALGWLGARELSRRRRESSLDR